MSAWFLNTYLFSPPLSGLSITVYYLNRIIQNFMYFMKVFIYLELIRWEKQSQNLFGFVNRPLPFQRVFIKKKIEGKIISSLSGQNRQGCKHKSQTTSFFTHLGLLNPRITRMLTAALDVSVNQLTSKMKSESSLHLIRIIAEHS